MRCLFVWVHRWVGLTMTGFLVIVALTGSALAFREELDHWLNADLFKVPVRNAPRLDVFTLREKAQALEPRANADIVFLPQPPGETFHAIVSAKTDPATGKPYDLSFDQLFLDPYTGEKLGARKTAEVSLGRRGLLSFLFRLHYSLALPENIATYGETTLGVVALAWTVDCFIAFYLTFPLRLSAARAAAARRSWWSGWRPAWLVRWRGGAYRLNFDLHRAFGLWTWAMLFVFAWSSVGFNLRQVYVPAMGLVFDMGKLATEMGGMAHAETAQHAPALDFREAYARAKTEMASLAAANGLVIEDEKTFLLIRATGEYLYLVRSSKDWTKSGETAVYLDAESGVVKRVATPGEGTRGETVTFWLIWLHMASVFGLSMQIFVCAMGFVIAALCVTGVYIWWRKRKARFARLTRNSAATL
jgi:uncharacterized iron-regulated membrane protein